MKWFMDGNQVCVTGDDFENLQESPAVFVPADSLLGRCIQRDGLDDLPFNEWLWLWVQLVPGRDD
jgi:hypothetical protein